MKEHFKCDLCRLCIGTACIDYHPPPDFCTDVTHAAAWVTYNQKDNLVPNTDDEVTPTAALAVTEPAPPEPEEASDDGPSYRVVTGFGVVFARDLPWPSRALPEGAWDKIRDDLGLHGGVEVFEYLPPTEYEDDPEGPFLAIAVTGSLTEVEGLNGVIRDLPKYDGSWPTFIAAALDVLRAAHPTIAAFILEEPPENMRPARFILVEEVDEDEDQGE